MGNDSVIFIRTDGNSKIATGHLVRCLCIAQALEKEGKTIIFLVSDKESHRLLSELSSSIFSDYAFSFKTKILNSGIYDNLDAELTELTAFLSSYHNPVLFVDSYYVTPNYFATLRPVTKLAYMDDIQAFDYDVDLVINYDVIPPSREAAYEQAYTNAGKRLLGAVYTPLRPQFQKQSFHVNDRMKDILITTGGSDPYHFCEAMVSSLLSENKEITFHIVVGKLFSEETIIALEKLADTSDSIKLHRNVTNMADLMKQCDFAISAAGTTLYELCAIGVPAISFTFANNQLTMAETFAQVGAIPYAGDLRDEYSTELICNSTIQTEISKDIFYPENKKENIIHTINITLKSLFFSPDTRKELHIKMKSLMDGNGTSKIAKALCHLA